MYWINIRYFILFTTVLFLLNNKLLSQEAYFDISDQEIQIRTDFNGKEVIIFGLTDPSFNTILTIKGPKKNIMLSKKERVFGFWLETKKIVYKDIPSIFFISSSSPINDILNYDLILKKGLLFEELVSSLITKRNFINQKEILEWNTNLIRLQKNKQHYKNYDLKIVDNKLFQSRIFFPNTTIPGIYNVDIIQTKNKQIISERNKRIIIKKTGIGNKIYIYAQKNPAIYGLVSIFFAITAGLAAAAVFRRL